MAFQGSSSKNAMNRLFRRCVECPDDTPVCPSCAPNEACSLVPQSCNACASMVCTQVSAVEGSQQAGKKSTPIGGIIGGVLAGVVVICIITFLLWRYCLRGKRRDTWEPPEKSTARNLQPRPRANSIASTVLTRASNVIQIAYIPGVTVRSAPDTPDVPNRPSTYGGSTVDSSPHADELFFRPSNLRDSQWSEATSIASGSRISLTPSLARSSMAASMYQHDAEVPEIPAQYAVTRQANVVSVKSGATTPNSAHRLSPSPPIPHMPQLQTINGSQIVARNVTARPVEIKKQGSSGSNVPTLTNLATASQSRIRKVNVPSVSDEKEVVMSPSLTVIEDSPSSPRYPPRQAYTMSMDAASTSGISAVLPANSPLGSNSAAALNASNTGTTADISAMILDALKGASQDAPHTSTSAYSSQRPELHKHDSGPFSDINEIRDHRGP